MRDVFIYRQPARKSCASEFNGFKLTGHIYRSWSTYDNDWLQPTGCKLIFVIRTVFLQFFLLFYSELLYFCK